MPNRIAIVTGGSRGIGRGIVLALAADHWTIVVNYNADAHAANATLAQVEKLGGKGLAIQADISLPHDRDRLVSETLRHFGKIDLLVNNAGVAPHVRADLIEASEASFDRVININLKGPYFLTQRVAHEMIRLQKTGAYTSHPPHIVTISSISAYTASVDRGDYCIAKAGLSMMTALFAARLAEFGINVYEIRPGFVATDMTGPVKAKYDKLIAEGLTPIKRWGQPDDIARAVLALASGTLPFSTGEVINVDGGFHLRRL